MKIGFFGSFYPRIDRLSTTSIGLAYLFGNVSYVEEITVFGPLMSRIPPNFPAKVNLNSIWEYDDILSIFKTLKTMLLDRKHFDLFFFNLILTSFGRRGLSNALGLLVPVLLSFLTRKRVIVYLHHIVETQNLGELGYGEKKLSAAIAMLIERLVFVTTRVIVPLPSQQSKISSFIRSAPRQLVFPGLEGIWAYNNYLRSNISSRVRGFSGIRILMFGAIGPQKDIARILNILGNHNCDLKSFHLTVAGSINSNFPQYERKFEEMLTKFNNSNLTYIKNPREEDIPELFINADVLLLPYKAAGGYSAVMNVAKLYCIRVLCYANADLQLFSDLIDIDARFVSNSMIDDIVQELKAFVWEPRVGTNIESVMEKNVQMVNQLFGTKEYCPNQGVM
ncbi:MAG: glycosyltransferase [Candidatus Thermoplasmatota archaeon]|jgi:glycosyltransferase involved in cell wall biosynthesis|nr:glycosyltransferase [Candidatus Thermoplasmatota archaeon]